MNGSYFDPDWAEQVTVPVKRVGERWEFFYGGDVPVKEGTLGELKFSANQILGEEFRRRATAELAVKVLEEGTPLLVALSNRGKSNPYASYEPRFFPQGIPPGTSQWEKIHLGPLKKSTKKHSLCQQELIPETGGLWLKLRGFERCDLASSTIVMPVGFPEPTAISLNHAFTLLSRVYEIHRISNTGNVYTRVFYQHRDECWYPLDDLRRGVQAQGERQLLNELWVQVEKLLGWRPIPETKRRR